jgi:hypothetical protein
MEILSSDTIQKCILFKFIRMKATRKRKIRIATDDVMPLEAPEQQGINITALFGSQCKS